MCIHTRATKKLLIYNTRMYYTCIAKINPHHFVGNGGEELTTRVQFVFVCHAYILLFFLYQKKKMNERIRLVLTTYIGICFSTLVYSLYGVHDTNNN